MKNTCEIIDQKSNTFLSFLEEKEAALFKENNVPTKFSFQASHLKYENLTPFPDPRRVDLRDMLTFTIDCDETKDRDDALSISYDGVYHLGVHIADVSAYVTPNSILSREAMERGCSIYLPNKTIPMLPEILSNDLCSLDCEDRNTVSTLMDIDREGNVLSYRIEKTMIHSSLIGSYSEVNAVLSGQADSGLMKRYSAVFDSLVLLRRLSNALRCRRTSNGADTASDKAQPRISFADGTVLLTPHLNGIAEMIVEEAMVQANTCVADFFRRNNLPALYRVQEAKGELAAYQAVHNHHASLALENYSHTTSPIRRLPDLQMQTVLTAYLSGCSNECLHYMFDALLTDSAVIATKRSRRAKEIQNKCASLCYHEFFWNHRYEEFQGVVAGFGRNGYGYLRIDRLNISVPGIFPPSANLGQRVAFRVDAKCSDSKYYAYSILAA